MTNLTASPTAAARAAQETREQTAKDAWRAYLHDSRLAVNCMDTHFCEITQANLDTCRTALTACLSHLDDIEARLPGSARQGQVRDVAEGDPAYLEEQGR